MAGRYATALVDLANESKSLDAVAGELKRVKDLLDGSLDCAWLGSASSTWDPRYVVAIASEGGISAGWSIDLL